MSNGKIFTFICVCDKKVSATETGAALLVASMTETEEHRLTTMNFMRRRDVILILLDIWVRNVALKSTSANTE